MNRRFIINRTAHMTRDAVGGRQRWERPLLVNTRTRVVYARNGALKYLEWAIRIRTLDPELRNIDKISVKILREKGFCLRIFPTPGTTFQRKIAETSSAASSIGLRGIEFRAVELAMIHLPLHFCYSDKNYN